MPDTLTLKPRPRITIGQIVEQAERAMKAVNEVRGRMLAPNLSKVPPTFSSLQVATLCGIDRNQFNYRLSKGDLPAGGMAGSRREFSLAETRAWVSALRKDSLRPPGARAVTVSIGNFKGGVAKTTTCMTLAQGLSLRGHKVLVVDCDPQGSLTTLFGLLPDTEIGEDETVARLVYDEDPSIVPAIRGTYWDGIDLVPACTTLFSVEFALPARHMQERDFRFWDVLNLGLEDVREAYDVILIDTAPALSYLTINAFMASEGLIVPLPPNALDFASSAQFWNLFSDLSANLVEKEGLEKAFDFIHVLMSRVDASDSATSVVQSWITATYGEKVLPVEVPKTVVTSASAAEFGTVYDLSRYDGNQKTYRRARDAYDRVTDLIEDSIRTSWAQQLGQGA
jgi:chromosome partitioning protein